MATAPSRHSQRRRITRALAQTRLSVAKALVPTYRLSKARPRGTVFPASLAAHVGWTSQRFPARSAAHVGRASQPVRPLTERLLAWKATPRVLNSIYIYLILLRM